ncbi:MAG: hypothetical protein R2716_02675 [Microthrixaceae bacterium]
MKKVFFAAVALVVLVALVSRGGSLVDDADARVDMELDGSVDLDEAREQLTTEATGSWQATRTAESTDSEDEAMVEFALPGPSLDGFIAALRRYPDARDVQVTLDVDPERLETPSLGSEAAGDAAPEPEPVRVQVNLSSPAGQGPMVTIVGALLVALIAAGGLALVWRHFGSTEPETTADEPSRRWTQRP